MAMSNRRYRTHELHEEAEQDDRSSVADAVGLQQLRLIRPASRAIPGPAEHPPELQGATKPISNGGQHEHPATWHGALPGNHPAPYQQQADAGQACRQMAGVGQQASAATAISQSHWSVAQGVSGIDMSMEGQDAQALVTI